MLIEEDVPPTNDASSPAVEGPTSWAQEVAGEVELTKSPKREDVEMREFQCVTGSEPTAPATTATDVPGKQNKQSAVKEQKLFEKYKEHCVYLDFCRGDHRHKISGHPRGE